MVIEICGSQLIGRGLVMRQRGQWHSMWLKPSAWNSSIVVHMLFGEKVGGLTVCKKREPIDPSFLEKVVERRRQIQDAS